MVELHQERDLVRVFSGDRSEHPERGGDGVAAAFDGQLDDVFRIEIHRVGRERRSRRMLDPLIDRQNRHVAGAGQPPVSDERLQASEDARLSIGSRIDAVDVVGTRQMQ